MRPALPMLALAAAFALAHAAPARAEEEPTRWEQLFFPFPIVGAPPQLEAQVQLFVNVFTGRRGGAAVPSLEVAYVVSPHFGLVASMPYQLGFGGQRFGTGDLQLSGQYLAAGSLRLDDLLSIGVQLGVPTAQHDLGAGDVLLGPFAYAAQRFWQRLILELNVTALVPLAHAEIARRFAINAMVSTLVTPRRFVVPIYVQCEVDSNTYVGGIGGVPETVYVAPEIFIGPVHGVRGAAGVAFNVHGDAVHAAVYSLTVAVDLPNRFGY